MPSVGPEEMRGGVLALARALDLETAVGAVVRTLAASEDTALARLWLLAPGDVCVACPMRIDCPDQTRCLHLAASAGNPRQRGADIQQRWGQAVVVDNKPGASGNIGTGLAARAAPDGNTILMIAKTFVTNVSIFRSIPYDPVKSFTPIIKLATGSIVLAVHPSLPVKSAKEFIAYVKARPGEVNYGSPGFATPHHLAMEMFKQATGTSLTHIPYKGTSQSLPDLVAGRVAFTIDNLGPILPFIRSGQLVALGVSTREPVSLLPGVPPINSVLEGYELSSWNALAMPANTPKDIVSLVGKECDRIVHLPEVAEKMRSFGSEPVGGTPEQLAEFLKKERVRWEAAVKAAKIPKQ